MGHAGAGRKGPCRKNGYETSWTIGSWEYRQVAGALVSVQNCKKVATSLRLRGHKKDCVVDQ